MTTLRTFAVVVLVVGGCATGNVPASVRSYAKDLPARADGQYAPLDGDLKKQLVMKDAALQCAIDTDDKVPGSTACRCAASASADWKQDCKDWLGEHLPKT